MNGQRHGETFDPFKFTECVACDPSPIVTQPPPLLPLWWPRTATDFIFIAPF